MKAQRSRNSRKSDKPLEGAALEARAMEVSALLGALANPRRLIILCRLSMVGECSVGALAQALSLSQSALSQHLAVLRAQNVVGTRRDGLTIYYSISDPQTRALMRAMEAIFCQVETGR